MKKYLKFLFLPLIVFLLTFAYLSASEDVILEQEVNEGDLFIYFVNELKEYVHTPSAIIFSFIETSFEDQDSTAVLGTDEETIRIDNATTGEVVLSAALDVTTFVDDAKWTAAGDKSYLAYGDGSSGGLEIDPIGSSVVTEGCEVGVVSRGSASRFTPTTSESIDIFTTTGGGYCRYDLTGVDLTQTIPAKTPAGNYSLGMVLTLTGGAKWIPEYILEYIAGDNGSISGNTYQTVSYGEDGTAVTADSNIDYHFLMWSDVSTVNPRTDTNVIEDISVDAIFQADTTVYTVEVYANPSGGGNVSVDGTPVGEFNYGDSATVNTTTETGYEFIGWSDEDEIVSETPEYMFTVTGNRVLIAEFELEEYDLTISAGSGGTTEPSPGVYTHTYGHEAKVYAIPDSGYVFDGWTGDCVGTGDCEVTMTSNKSVTAGFSSTVETLHTVSYTSTSGGSVLPSARVVVNAGTSPSPDITTEAGYELVNFSATSGSVNGELNVETGEVTNVTGDMTVQANFTSFDPCDGEINIEVEGQTYSLVGIGDQCWMQENLNYDGHVSGQSWCYENDSSYCDTYGRLYNWEAANSACPEGTSLPSDSDWRELEEYLGMSDSELGSLRWRGEDVEVGTLLKTSSWGGTNASGFTALSGGWRFYYEQLTDQPVWRWWDANEHLVRGKFWSSSESGADFAFYRGLQRDETGAHRWAPHKGDGYSVRCLIEAEEELGSAWTFEVSIPENNDNFKFGMTNSDVTIDWGDVLIEEVTNASDIYVEHVYATAGDYEITLDGTANHISFCDLDAWGWSCASGMTPEKLNDILTPIPASFGLTSAASMFEGTLVESFTAEDFFDYAIGNVTSTANMFAGTNDPNPFNQDISQWDTSNVTDMYGMFRQNSAFNQDIGTWDTSNVTNMSEMFQGDWNAPTAFNGNISDWDTGNVVNMSYMFRSAIAFNQDIGGWDVSSVEDMFYMFYEAQSFNQDLTDWNTSSVTDIEYMFWSAHAFNGDISGWDVSNIDSLQYTFQHAYAFNSDISEWNVSQVSDYRGTFNNAYAFNSDIGGWDVSSALNMSSMFQNASSFNQDIGNWDVSNLSQPSRMSYMFYNASDFNQDLSGWCVTNITEKPLNFDNHTDSWTLPKPVWGTCPE